MNKYNPRGCAYFHILRLSSRHHSCTHRPDILYRRHTVYIPMAYIPNSIFWPNNNVRKNKMLKNFRICLNTSMKLCVYDPQSSSAAGICRWNGTFLFFFPENATDVYFFGNELLAYSQIQAFPILHLLQLGSTAQRSITSSFPSSFLHPPPPAPSPVERVSASHPRYLSIRS